MVVDFIITLRYGSQIEGQPETMISPISPYMHKYNTLPTENFLFTNFLT